MDPAVLERLREVPQREYALAALKIVPKAGADVVPLDLTGRPGQIKLNDAIERQKAENRPVRVVLVKSRQFGGSTWIMGELAKRVTTTGRRKVLIVAHRLDTAESLFSMGLTMWENLPENMRPPMGGFNNPTRGTKILHLGEKVGGIVTGWPNSRISIDTAEEFDAGRGLTFTDLLFTEASYYAQNGAKALGIMNAVPDLPGTSIFIESTAQGQNWFYDKAKAAANGTSEFELVFVGWHEDPDCSREFRSAELREEFIATIGQPGARSPGSSELVGPVAEDEDMLVETFDVTPEQLNFRRFAVVDKTKGSIELFRQEYPSTWQEAFLGSGRQVFSVIFTQRMIKDVERWAKTPAVEGGPQKGIFMGQAPRTRELSDGTVDVPTRAVWVPETEIPARAEFWPGKFWQPKDPTWTLWLPEERTAEQWRQAHEQGEVDLEGMEAGMERATRGPGQYIVAGDAAGDTYNDVPSEMAKTAFNTLEAIDHISGEQVAEWRGRVGHDDAARQAFLAGLYLNEALVSIEVQGGYGEAIIDYLVRRYYYRRVYQRKVLSDKKQREVNEFGWLTNRATKPRMEVTAQALLREGSHGIRSPLLAAEFSTYVKDPKNPVKHEPEFGSFSDLLLAWMQAQELRRIRRPKPPPPPPGAQRPNSMVRRVQW